MKILYVATVRSHIGQFHMPVIHALKKEGHIVHAAFKDNSADKKGLDLSEIDRVFEVPFNRSPYSSQNVKAYNVLKKIIDEGNYDLIHCHTPMGAVVTRLAAKDARKKGTKVFYTAHGFHFFTGAPLKNWLMFFPVEKYLSQFTDVLITINQEDYDCAIKHQFKPGKLVKINGVGVNLSKFHVTDESGKQQIRESLGIPKDAVVLLYAADLSYRKNQSMIFKALAELKAKYPNIYSLFPGQPILKKEYEDECAELGISDLVNFMGYRRDIDQLLSACDCVVSSSKQEGLPLNLIEAAACGKYIIATDVRGNADVVKQSGYGHLVSLNDSHAMAAAISDFIEKPVQRPEDFLEKMQVFEEKQIVSALLQLYGVDPADHEF